MRDFWAFRKMVTPIIIRFIFWVGIIACVIGGFVLISAGIHPLIGMEMQMPTRKMVLSGVLLLLFGPLAVRVYCEFLIVFFRINETLMEIKHVLERKSFHLE